MTPAPPPLLSAPKLDPLAARLADRDAMEKANADWGPPPLRWTHPYTIHDLGRINTQIAVLRKGLVTKWLP